MMKPRRHTYKAVLTENISYLNSPLFGRKAGKVRGDYVPVVTVSRHPLPWVVRLAGGWAWPVGVAAEGGSDAVTC